MAESFLSNPIFVTIVVVALFSYVVIIIIMKLKGKGSEFKPIKSTDTQYNELKEKLKTQGIKIGNGKLIVGTNKIAHVVKWLRVNGKLINYFYDENSKEYKIDETAEKTPYDILILHCRNKNIIYNILGIKKIFFMIDYKSVVKFDPLTNSFVLKDGTDLIPQGNIWLNSDTTLEYVNDISIKRMNIEIMTALENYPNKIVHLEMQQAKKERTYREIMETDKAKYDAIKKAEDSAIS